MDDEYLSELTDKNLLDMQKDMLRAHKLLRPAFDVACKRFEGQIEIVVREKKKGNPTGKLDSNYVEEEKLLPFVNAYTTVVSTLLTIESMRAARAIAAKQEPEMQP